MLLLGVNHLGKGPQLFHHSGENKPTVRLRIDASPELFSGTSEYFDIVRYLIPVKRPENLLKEAQELYSSYKPNSYNLVENNCEHAAAQLLGFGNISQQQKRLWGLSKGIVAAAF